MGGLEYDDKEFLNDIWYSDDGYNWINAKNAAWQPRGAHALIVFKNKLWLFGGANGITEDRGTNKFLNDIWSSEDGINWIEEVHTAPWAPRDYPRMLVFNDSLYMIGGRTGVRGYMARSRWYELDRAITGSRLEFAL